MKNIKKISYLITLTILMVLLSCKSTEKVTSINENPLNLDNFDFKTKIDTLLPLKNIEYDSYIFYRKYYDHNYIIHFGKEKILADYKDFIGYEYLQGGSTSIDTLAIFKENAFNEIHFATDKENDLVVVCAVGTDNNEELFNNLNDKFGKYTEITPERQKENKSLYQWKTGEYIIRLTTYRNKIKKSDNRPIKIVSGNYENETSNHNYLFFIREDYMENIKYLNSGDLSEID